MSVPRIFTEKGELIKIDTSKLDEPTRERYNRVHNAYHLDERVRVQLDDAVSEVSAALEAVANTENYFNAHFPPQNYHDLWKENFGGGPRNRMTGRH